MPPQPQPPLTSRAPGPDSRELPEPPLQPIPLGRNRDFQVLLVGQGISAIGDAVTFTALPLLVLQLTGSGLQMGIVGVLSTLPHLLVGLFAGALADRADRRRMMLVADLGRAALTACIPLSAVLGLPTMGVIFLVTAPMHVLGTIFLAAYTASTPNLVDRAQIGQATSVFEAFYSLGYIVGPIIAGVLSATIGPGPTIAVDAVSFLLSGAALFFVRRPLQAYGEREPAHILADIREGVAYVAHDPVLRTLITFWGAVSVAGAGLVPVLTFFITRDRGMSASALGLIVAAYGVGTVAGAVLSSRLGRGRVGGLLLGGNLVRGAILVAIALIGRFEAIVPLVLIAGIADSLVLVTYIAVRAASAPDDLIGRVGGTMRTISVGLQPIGVIVAGVALDAVRGQTTIVAMGALLCGISLLALPSRALRELRVVRGAADRQAR
jgi:predicted MFS family arabinose efflux permease